MPKIFRVHTRFVPKSSETSNYVFLTPGDYSLEDTQPSDGGLRVITRNRMISVYVRKEEVEQYGALVDSSFLPAECHIHTIEEVAKLLKDSASGVSFHGDSAHKLAEWLVELSEARRAIAGARESLAKARR